MILSRQITNPVMYEINARVWIRRFQSNGHPVTLKEIPDEYWWEISEEGFDYLWLMGAWQTNENIRNKYCFTPELTREYYLSLPDWELHDVVGSPYAIDNYSINSVLGAEDEIIKLKQKLNAFGIKLILDFVPNHFSAGTRLIGRQPGLFLMGDVEEKNRHPNVYFHPDPDSGNVFAHGRDPNFEPWEDTIQVNIFDESARAFMTETLLKIASLCDGIRCDMAMLILNDIFYRTWKNILDKHGFKKPASEFWESAIKTVRNTYSSFVFIAEAYWDTGWQLQQLGFDYTYDKEFYDRLRYGSAKHITSHLLADHEYQRKSVRFIENHDEGRARNVFGDEKSKAAAIAISTIKGMCFFQDGQFEGRKIRLPVQLGREKSEEFNKKLKRFYQGLMKIRKTRIIQSGRWELIWPESAVDGNDTHNNFLSWIWANENSRLLVVINYSDVDSVCRIRLDIPLTKKFIIFSDMLHGVSYKREITEIVRNGLYVEREPYNSHIFYFYF